MVILWCVGSCQTGTGADLEDVVKPLACDYNVHELLKFVQWKAAGGAVLIFGEGRVGGDELKPCFEKPCICP